MTNAPLSPEGYTMTIKAECAACGQDCSNCNGTYMGDIYHIGCLPSKLKRTVSPYLTLPLRTEAEVRELDPFQDAPRGADRSIR